MRKYATLAPAADNNSVLPSKRSTKELKYSTDDVGSLPGSCAVEFASAMDVSFGSKPDQEIESRPISFASSIL